MHTVQYSTVQYSTVQYSTVQYSTVQYSTVQFTRPSQLFRSNSQSSFTKKTLAKIPSRESIWVDPLLEDNIARQPSWAKRMSPKHLDTKTGREPPWNFLQINVSTEPSWNLLRIQVGWRLPGTFCKSM